MKQKVIHRLPTTSTHVAPITIVEGHLLRLSQVSIFPFAAFTPQILFQGKVAALGPHNAL